MPRTPNASRNSKASARASSSFPSFWAARASLPLRLTSSQPGPFGRRAARRRRTSSLVFARASGRTRRDGSHCVQPAPRLYRVVRERPISSAHGPARGPHGFFRVDEWDLTDRLQPGENVVAFEVAGYNVNSYSLLDQPSFLQAEVVAGGKVLASTDGKGAAFTATILKERRAEGAALQLPAAVLRGLSARAGLRPLAQGPGDRACGEAKVSVLPARSAAAPSRGLSRLRRPPAVLARCPGPGQDRPQGGPPVEGPLAHRHRPEARRLPGEGPGNHPLARTADHRQRHQPAAQSALGARQLAAASHPTPGQIVDLGCNLTGFIGAKVTCRSKTRLFLTFDEILSNGDVDFKRLGCVNIIGLRTAARHLRAGILRALHAALPEAHRARGRLRSAEPLSARVRRRRRLAGALRRQR